MPAGKSRAKLEAEVLGFTLRGRKDDRHLGRREWAKPMPPLDQPGWTDQYVLAWLDQFRESGPEGVVLWMEEQVCAAGALTVARAGELGRLKHSMESRFPEIIPIDLEEASC